MRIAVIGAGLTGVSTALELALRGHEVHVVERRHAVAAEGSFAPGGLSAPELAGAPALAGLALSHRHPWSAAAWRLRAWQTQRSRALAERRAALTHWATQGNERLNSLLPLLSDDLEQQSGLLVLLPGDKDRTRAEALWAAQAGGDAPPAPPSPLADAMLDTLEPRLTRTPGLQAWHWPAARALNLRQLAQQLRDQARRLGVQFHLGIEVLAVKPGAELVWQDSGDSSGVADRPDTVLPALPPQWDAIVLCNGAGAPALLARLDLRWPWAVAHQVSITAPLHTDEAHPQLGPQRAVVDFVRQVSIARMGHRVRVAGALRLERQAPALEASRLQPLYEALEHWFPGAVRTARAQQWQGSLAVLSDGLPVAGPLTQAGLWVNLGLGRHGAAAALGAAEWLADGMTPVRDPATARAHPLSPSRWG